MQKFKWLKQVLDIVGKKVLTVHSFNLSSLGEEWEEAAISRISHRGQRRVIDRLEFGEFRLKFV